MKKALLILLLAIITFPGVALSRDPPDPLPFNEKISCRKFFESYYYYVGDRALTHPEEEQQLLYVPEAYAEYQAAEGTRTYLVISGLAGGGFLGYTLGKMMIGQVTDEDLLFLLPGAVFSGIYIMLSIRTHEHHKNAVEIYNDYIESRKQANNFNIFISFDQIGIAYRY